MNFLKANSYKLTARSGQSLVELLVAITIGGMIIGSAVVAIRLSLKSDTQTQLIKSATPLLSGFVDSAKSAAAGDWYTFYNLPNKGVSSKYYFVRDSILKIIEGEEGVLGEDVVSGLAGYWKLDEASGTVAYDYTANNNKGTLSGPTRTAVLSCKIGRCLSFDGSDDHVNLQNMPLTTTWTMSAWVKRSAGTGARTIMDFNDNTNVCYLRVGEATANAPSIGCSGSLAIAPTMNISDGVWHHVAGVRSGSTAYLYVDGVQVGSDTSFTTGSFTSTNSRIGRELWQGADYFPWDGSLDDLRIYSRALSAAEITQLYGSKIYNRSFSVENVDRDDLGRGSIVTSGGTEDPSTQKVVATVTPALGATAISATQYIIRSRNSTNLFSDWSGSVDTTGVYVAPTPNYSGIDSANPVDVSVPGQIKLPGS